MNFDISDPILLAGSLLGAMLPFFFAALTMMSVGKAAAEIIQEVRRQFREVKNAKGITLLEAIQKVTANGTLAEEDDVDPDSDRCVMISTRSSVKEMIAPGLYAVFTPRIAGFMVGPRMLTGLLAGCIGSAAMMAAMMGNAGGAWNNSKKFRARLALWATQLATPSRTRAGDLVESGQETGITHFDGSPRPQKRCKKVPKGAVEEHIEATTCGRALTSPKQFWKMVDQSRKLQGVFGPHQALWRVHLYLSAAAQHGIRGRMGHSLAVILQLREALVGGGTERRQVGRRAALRGRRDRARGWRELRAEQFQPPAGRLAEGPDGPARAESSAASPRARRARGCCGGSKRRKRTAARGARPRTVHGLNDSLPGRDQRGGRARGSERPPTAIGERSTAGERRPSVRCIHTFMSNVTASHAFSGLRHPPRLGKGRSDRNPLLNFVHNLRVSLKGSPVCRMLHALRHVIQGAPSVQIIGRCPC